MSDTPRMKLTGIVLDTPDTAGLAHFYRRLLGCSTIKEEPGWVMLAAPDGGAGLSFQEETAYVRPVWPAGPGDQQMMLHLDIEVEDLAAASTYAASLGAVLADFQPQDQVRVFLDPAGHPFCLYHDDEPAS